MEILHCGFVKKRLRKKTVFRMKKFQFQINNCLKRQFWRDISLVKKCHFTQKQILEWYCLQEIATTFSVDGHEASTKGANEKIYLPRAFSKKFSSHYSESKLKSKFI